MNPGCSSSLDTNVAPDITAVTSTTGVNHNKAKMTYRCDPNDRDDRDDRDDEMTEMTEMTKMTKMTEMTKMTKMTG